MPFPWQPRAELGRRLEASTAAAPGLCVSQIRNGSKADTSECRKAKGFAHSYTDHERNFHSADRLNHRCKWRLCMRSALLWLIGVPIPIILLLAFCTHHL